MNREAEQGVFSFQSKAMKIILIVCSVGMAFCLVALACVLGAKPNFWLIWGLVVLLTGVQLGYLALNFKNAQLTVTPDALEYTGPTKNSHASDLTRSPRSRLTKPGDQGPWAVVRAENARISINRGIQDWPRLKAILESLQPNP